MIVHLLKVGQEHTYGVRYVLCDGERLHKDFCPDKRFFAIRLRMNKTTMIFICQTLISVFVRDLLNGLTSGTSDSPNMYGYVSDLTKGPRMRNDRLLTPILHQPLLTCYRQITNTINLSLLVRGL